MSENARRKTPLYPLYRTLGARLLDYAGWMLPLQFGGGPLHEHRHTRKMASLFDVSHMGQFVLRGKSRTAALEKITPGSGDLSPGQARYALMLNENGGVVDDLIITNDGDSLSLIVNAARRDADWAHLQAHLPPGCELEEAKDGNGNHFALLALQGPLAAEALRTLCQEASALAFMEAAQMQVGGVPCRVARGGYTGEDGFELSVPAGAAPVLWTRLLELDGVLPAGLVARDSLRLEAGLCLYGNELNETITPAEAGLMWTIPQSRREDGGFIGFEAIRRQSIEGIRRLRIGLKPEGKVPVRGGAILLNEGGGEIGKVSSGIFSPTLERPIAMGYVATEFSELGEVVYTKVRGRVIACQIVPLPFVPRAKLAG